MADPRNHRMPPVGVKLTTDVERRTEGFRARVRWTDPSTKKRVGRVSHVRTAEEVEEFFEQMRAATETGNDTTITLAAYAASIGDRWQRGLDPTSTAELYDTGLRLRVLPALGHIRVAKITAGMIDRTIDGWEAEHSASTIKNSIAPLVRVLDEAVRDDIISINPAKHRARRNLGKHVTHTTGALRQYALPDLSTLQKLATACGKVHQSYSDHVMLAPSSPHAAPKSQAFAPGTWTGTTASCGSDASTTPAEADSSSNRPKAEETDPSRCSTPSNLSSNDSPTARSPTIRSCAGHAAGSSPLPPSGTRRTGTASWQDSASATSPVTACATPEQPGWPTPASPYTSSRKSSGTSRSRPPRGICTPITGTSPKPRDRPISSSPRPLRERTPAAATDPACDRLQNPAPTLPEGAGASSCADSGPLHGHLLVHFTRNDADPDWSTSAADGSSRSSQWTSQ